MAKKRQFPELAEFQKHLRQNAIVAHGGGKIFPPMKFKLYQYQADVADEGSFTLPLSVGFIAWGFITAESSTIAYEVSMFILSGSGNVSLIAASTNIVANSDTDGKLCIGTAASQEPLVIKNRLGVSRHITLWMMVN